MSSPSPEPLPEGSLAKLSVVRGQRVGAAYPIKEGSTMIGREGGDAVDVNLDELERAELPVAAPQHACVRLENNCLTVEDLKTEHGTYVNRTRLAWSTPYPIKADDIIQIGTVQFRVAVKVKKKTGAAK
ncbi:MAG: FHA domain-containing protein [Gemmataceae bacterium]|nr:FHA domain-containing protein [Gemmataceae bacterium]